MSLGQRVCQDRKAVREIAGFAGMTRSEGNRCEHGSCNSRDRDNEHTDSSGFIYRHLGLSSLVHPQDV
jgi:hypothetical protein